MITFYKAKRCKAPAKRQQLRHDKAAKSAAAVLIRQQQLAKKRIWLEGQPSAICSA